MNVLMLDNKKKGTHASSMLDQIYFFNEYLSVRLIKS